MSEERRRAAWPALVIAAIALVIGILVVQSSKGWNPVNDEVEYLHYGRTLALTGQFAQTPAGPAADKGPGREPLYPALVAAVMVIDPALLDASADCIGVKDNPACPSIYRSLRWTNALLIAAAAALAYLTARALAFGPVACWAAGLYIALNLNAMKSLRYVISDYLALLLAAGLAYALALAVKRHQSLGRWIVVGLLTGLMVLTKGIYELYLICAVIALLAAAAIDRNRGYLKGAIAVAVCSGVIIGAWVARNDAVFGRPVLTDSRGAIALSTREELDHMNAGQYAAAFLWWLRGPGPGIARALLPESAWHRFELYTPDGYYMMGQVTNFNARVERLKNERGLSQADAEASVSGVIVREILGEFPSYVATTLPVFFRGLWFDEFVVLGFPALLWLTIRFARRRRWDGLAVLGPAWFSLIAYALLSLNITRYQLTAITGLALAGGLAVETLWPRLQTWVKALAPKRRGVS